MRIAAQASLLVFVLGLAGCATSQQRPAASSVSCARAVVAELPPGLNDLEKHASPRRASRAMQPVRGVAGGLGQGSAGRLRWRRRVTGGPRRRSHRPALRLGPRGGGGAARVLPAGAGCATRLDFAPPREPRDVLAGTERKSLDRHRGLAAAGRDEARAIADEQVRMSCVRW